MLDFIYKHKTIIGIILVIIIALGAGSIIYSTEKSKDNLKISEEKIELSIDIEGAVKNPGVYTMKNGSLIQDAINIAGGLLETADNELLAKDVNRAELLKNNQKIIIPFKPQPTPEVAGETIAGKININTATLEQLDTLPGIGPVYGQRIIDYRKKKSFSSLEEIMEIQGIGEKTFEKFKDLITI
ncbi:ComEA family DNA-binding protein [Patescibacteria group bacterium]|nr:ComEA family DNA-binding protein [Patescibacteria group bacterium]